MYDTINLLCDYSAFSLHQVKLLIKNRDFDKYSKNSFAVAFKIYDIDRDGYISNGELFQVLKMMVGNNLKDAQLQQIVDKTIIYSDKDGDGKISYEEFCAVSEIIVQHNSFLVICLLLPSEFWKFQKSSIIHQHL